MCHWCTFACARLLDLRLPLLYKMWKDALAQFLYRSFFQGRTRPLLHCFQHFYRHDHNRALLYCSCILTAWLHLLRLGKNYNILIPKSQLTIDHELQTHSDKDSFETGSPPARKQPSILAWHRSTHTGLVDTSTWGPPTWVSHTWSVLHKRGLKTMCKASTAMGAVGSSSAVSLKSGFLSTIVNPRCTPLLIRLSLHPQTEPNNSKSTVAWLQQLLHSLLFIIYSGARTVTEPPTFLASFLEPITTWVDKHHVTSY